MLVNPPWQCGLFAGTPYKRDEAIHQSYLLFGGTPVHPLKIQFVTLSQP